jgi:hypothetical protein
VLEEKRLWLVAKKPLLHWRQLMDFTPAPGGKGGGKGSWAFKEGVSSEEGKSALKAAFELRQSALVEGHADAGVAQRRTADVNTITKALQEARGKQLDQAAGAGRVQEPPAQEPPAPLEHCRAVLFPDATDDNDERCEEVQSQGCTDTRCALHCTASDCMVPEHVQAKAARAPAADGDLIGAAARGMMRHACPPPPAHRVDPPLLAQPHAAPDANGDTLIGARRKRAGAPMPEAPPAPQLRNARRAAGGGIHVARALHAAPMASMHDLHACWMARASSSVRVYIHESDDEDDDECIQCWRAAAVTDAIARTGGGYTVKVTFEQRRPGGKPDSLTVTSRGPNEPLLSGRSWKLAAGELLETAEPVVRVSPTLL